MLSNKIKLTIIGDGGVGKTTFTKSLMKYGEFEDKYIATFGCGVNILKLNSTIGEISFSLWDVSSQDIFSGLREDYYLDSQCCIIMFDVTSKISYENIGKWYQEFIKICPNAPIVLCGNKVDVEYNDRVIKPEHIAFQHFNKDIPYFEISTKSNFNIEKPLLQLIQTLKCNPNICFTDQLSLTNEPIVSKSEKSELDSMFGKIDLSSKFESLSFSLQTPDRPISGFSFGSNNSSNTTFGASTNTPTFAFQSSNNTKEEGINEDTTKIQVKPRIFDKSKTTFKLALIGDGAVGKTTFVQRHQFGEFQKGYVATLGVAVNPLKFYTSIGEITFDIWDVAGQDKFAMLREGYYIGSDCAILMFDVTSRMSYKEIPKFYAELRKVNGSNEIPIVLCGNKVDLKDRKVLPNQILFHRRHNLQYYDISTKSNYNFEKPFLYLIRALTGDPNVCFVAAPTIPPIELDNETINSYHAELNSISSSCVPCDSDDL